MSNEKPEQPVAWSQRRAMTQHHVLLPLYDIEWFCEWIAFYLARWAFLSILEYVGRFAVLVAVVSYIFGANDRRVQRDNSAWQIINMAYHESGNAGRALALEQLYKDKAALAGIDLSESWLIGINLEGADLHEGIFDNSDLTSANLRQVSLARARMQRVFLNKADLQNADLSEASMRGARLAEANLKGADLSVAHLEGAVFTDANLEGAKLYNAFLAPQGDSATLAIRANFTRVDFRHAWLSGLDVEGARFDYAKLCGTDLTSVTNLTQKQIDSAIVDSDTKLPAGLVASKVSHDDCDPDNEPEADILPKPADKGLAGNG
jgi:uncharacterized protein YjbI with pentapeptide repeats